MIEVTAEEQFTGTINFWQTMLKPILNEFVIAIRNNDIDLIKFLILKAEKGMREETIDGVDFIWSEQRIIGMEDKCLNGTILSIKDNRSMIYEHYRFLSTLLKTSYRLVNNKSPLIFLLPWKKWCTGVMTLKNCADQLETRIKIVLGKGGVCDKILERMRNDDYKLEPISI